MTNEATGLIGFLGKLHPAAVHFPIALVVVAGLAEGLYMISGRKRFSFTAGFMLTTGAIFAVPAAALGFAAAVGESFAGDLHSDFVWHRILGVAAPILVLLTLALGESARRTQSLAHTLLYRILFTVAIVVVATAGYLGGNLVFGEEHVH